MVFLSAATIHILVNFQLHGSLTVNALADHPDTNRFIPQFPLHEGRRKGVHRSSGIQLLTGIKGNKMRSFFNRTRIGPDDLTLVISDQEGQVFFQVL